ncbi:hypothetical protein CBF_3295 [Clostridium botulinum F str. 230613]|uniref:Uncharacterized protein n=1 Tax=Clostridium botulinum (strain Langeland / NCTC 10281 / Type F) TaxID=441772 RepID=A7GIA5_CLOBL|nr:hypothetical protein CLI_3303 [Clostridium botulinum F str. Langeland]ADG00880.1 hypothetical protein CBF_3295 [Clostridium botulinum F str. 230613]
MEEQIHNLLKKFQDKEKKEILRCAFNKLYNIKTSTNLISYNEVSIKKGV